MGNPFEVWFVFGKTQDADKRDTGLVSFTDEKAWHFDKKMSTMSNLVNLGLPWFIQKIFQDDFSPDDLKDNRNQAQSKLNRGKVRLIVIYVLIFVFFQLRFFFKNFT